MNKEIHKKRFWHRWFAIPEKNKKESTEKENNFHLNNNQKSKTDGKKH